MTDLGVPGAPTLANPDAVADAMDDDDVGSISLTITAPTTGGSDLTGYELQRWYGGQWTTVGPAPAADAKTYTDRGLEPGATYYYSLRAMNAMGAGPWSDVVSAVATAGNPDTPTLTADDIDETRIQLNWNVPEDNGTPIVGYQLQIWDGEVRSMWGDVVGFENDTTVTQYIDTVAAAGTYYYRIRALPQDIDTDDDEDGDTADEGWSAEDDPDGDNPPKGSTSATTSGDVPQAPVMGTLTPSEDSITITWTAIPDEDTGGSDITGYEVHKWDSSKWILEASLGATAESHMDTGLAAGTKYYYIVRAVNSQGPGKWANFVSSTTTANTTTPDTPVLTATARGTNSVQLTWTVPAA